MIKITLNDDGKLEINMQGNRMLLSEQLYYIIKSIGKKNKHFTKQCFLALAEIHGQKECKRLMDRAFESQSKAKEFMNSTLDKQLELLDELFGKLAKVLEGEENE